VRVPAHPPTNPVERWRWIVIRMMMMLLVFTVHIHNEWPKRGEWPHRTVRCGRGGRSGGAPKPLSMSKSNLLSGCSQAQRVTGPSKLLASAIPKGPVGTIFFLLPIQLAGVAPSIATAALPLVVSTGEEAPTPIFKPGLFFWNFIYYLSSFSTGRSIIGVLHWPGRLIVDCNRRLVYVFVPESEIDRVIFPRR
jgi:hypothetical protein